MMFFLGSTLFQVNSSIQHAETKTLEDATEDFFDMMDFRLIAKGWNIAMMNYLHENLHVACWFKLQSCMFLKPEEYHNGSLVPGHV